MEAKHQTGLVWFNLDLRLIDNLTLIRAAEQCQQLVCCFVIDESWFKGNRYGLNGISQPRWRYIQQAIADLAASLQQHGQQLIIRKGQPTTEISTLISTLEVDAVYCSDDPGVYERRRWDTLVKRFPYI
ncbi:MAG: deoxyribodipyrimidine photo-lyase, partial [Pseudomonadota bacterium]|nr:deoxyribodipyrimidine photo-lyase [Pseudomonadota bacterium]